MEVSVLSRVGFPTDVHVLSIVIHLDGNLMRAAVERQRGDVCDRVTCEQVFVVVWNCSHSYLGGELPAEVELADLWVLEDRLCVVLVFDLSLCEDVAAIGDVESSAGVLFDHQH